MRKKCLPAGRCFGIIACVGIIKTRHYQRHLTKTYLIRGTLVTHVRDLAFYSFQHDRSEQIMI